MILVPSLIEILMASSVFALPYHTYPLFLLLCNYRLLLTYAAGNGTVPGHVRCRTAKHTLRVVGVRKNKIRMLTGYTQNSFVLAVIDEYYVLGQDWLHTPNSWRESEGYLFKKEFKKEFKKDVFKDL